MKRFTAFAAHLLFWLFVITPCARGFQCNVCHSRNPAMVRMHKAVQEKEIGCFDCHKMGEKLMGKAKPTDLASLMARRSAEPYCVGCHGETRLYPLQ